MKDGFYRQIGIGSLYLFFPILTFLLAFFFAKHGIDLYHQGYMLKPAYDVAVGRVLFKETYFHYGILVPFLHAIFLVMFKGKFLGLQFGAAVFYGLIAALLSALWGNFLKRTYLIGACLLWLMLAPWWIYTLLPWPSVYSLCFQLVTVLLLYRFHEEKKARFLFYVGLSVAVVWGLRWTSGLVTLAATMMIIFCFKYIFKVWGKGKEHWLFYLFGIAVGVLPQFYYVISNGALSDWWHQTVAMNIVWASQYISLEDILGTFMAYSPRLLASQFGLFSNNLVWRLLPLSALIYPAFILKKYHATRILTKKDGYIFILAVSSLAMWSQYYPVPCVRHLYWSATAMFGILMAILDGIITFIKDNLKRSQFSKRLTVYAIILLILVGSGDVGSYIIKRLEYSHARIVKNMDYIEIQQPYILSGMRNERLLTESFARVCLVLKYITEKYPSYKIVPYVMFPGFNLFSDKLHQFHQIYFYLPSLVGRVYPDYVIKMNEALGDKETLVMTDNDEIVGDLIKLNPKLKPVFQLDGYFTLMKDEKISPSVTEKELNYWRQ